MSQADGNEPWELLSWDTNWFGFPIARINRPLSAGELDSFLKWERENGIRCTCYLCPVDQIQAIHIAQKAGFLFVDVRVQMERSLKKAVASRIADPALRLATPTDLPALRQLAIDLHQETRFFADERFPVERSQALYARWMENELTHPRGVVWVRPDETGTPVGYLTCNMSGNEGKIGLLGVSRACQGKGIGSSLLHSGLHWFDQQQCQTIHVITQGRNIGALTCYLSHDFLIVKQSLWLHRWHPTK